jgi:hypothetical protein
LSNSGKRAAAAAVRTTASPGAILKAARQIIQKRNKDMGFLMRKMDKDPSLSSKLKGFLDFQMSKLSQAEALCFILMHNLSRNSYLAFRALIKERGADLLPSWHCIQDEKSKCRPLGTVYKDFVAVTPLQPLLDKSMERLFLDPDLQAKVSTMADQSGDGVLLLRLYIKWGLDGTGNFTESHQQSESEEPRDPLVDEKSILATQMALVRLVTSDGRMVYQNPLVNSAKVCRPVRLAYVKETIGMFEQYPDTGLFERSGVLNFVNACVTEKIFA